MENADIMYKDIMQEGSIGHKKIKDEIMQMNIDKLKSRYPEGFDTELSNHRKSDDV